MLIRSYDDVDNDE